MKLEQQRKQKFTVDIIFEFAVSNKYTIKKPLNINVTPISLSGCKADPCFVAHCVVKVVL